MNSNTFTWPDYERFLVIRYQTGGHTHEAALHFAQGEISAILRGCHWTQGKPTAPDPQRLIIEALTPEDLEWFTELAGKYEYDAGLSRADAEIRALREIISRKYPEPPRPEYREATAIKKTLAAGIGIKEFFAKSKDNDPAAYTTDLRAVKAAWEQGVRRFKAFVRGRFLAIDIDRHLGKVDGLETFYKLWPAEILPAELQDIPGGSFPCYVVTPSGGYHLYFRYDGPELKLRELASGIEVKEGQITAPGSLRESGEYILHGELADAPPLYGFLLDHIEKVKHKQEQAKSAKLTPDRTRTRPAADRPMRFDKPRISLNTLVDEAAADSARHHARQVAFAGKAYRCKYSGADALAYVKSRPDVFGNDNDTENTVLSVFRDNGGRL